MYCIEDPAFDGSREQELVESLVKSITDKDHDGFQMAVSSFN